MAGYRSNNLDLRLIIVSVEQFSAYLRESIINIVLRKNQYV